MVYNHGINGHCTERPADEIDGTGGSVVGCRAQWQWTRRLCAVEQGREESKLELSRNKQLVSACH